MMSQKQQGKCFKKGRVKMISDSTEKNHKKAMGVLSRGSCHRMKGVMNKIYIFISLAVKGRNKTGKWPHPDEE